MSRVANKGREREEQFLQEMRSWTESPPHLSARMARQRILARLPERSDHRARWLMAVTSLAAICVVLVAGLVLRADRKDGYHTPKLSAELSNGTLLYVIETTAGDKEPGE